MPSFHLFRSGSIVALLLLAVAVTSSNAQNSVTSEQAERAQLTEIIRVDFSNPDSQDEKLDAQGKVTLKEGQLQIGENSKLNRSIAANCNLGVAIEVAPKSFGDNSVKYELVVQFMSFKSDVVQVKLTRPEKPESDQWIVRVGTIAARGGQQLESLWAVKKSQLDLAQPIVCELRHGEVTITNGATEILNYHNFPKWHFCDHIAIANKGAKIALRKLSFSHVPETALTDEETKKFGETIEIVRACLPQLGKEKLTELYKQFELQLSSMNEKQTKSLWFASLKMAQVELVSRLGDAEQLLESLKECQTIRAKLLGKKHPDTLMADMRIGNFFARRSVIKKGRELLNKLDSDIQTSLHRDHILHKLADSALATLAKNEGEFGEAAQRFARVAEWDRKNAGETSEQYARSLYNVAYMYRLEKQFSKAVASLEICRDIFAKNGTDNPVYATCLNNLGLSYKGVGNYSKAEECFLECARVREKLFGKQHIQYAAVLCSLGHVYRETGDSRRALRIYEQGAKIAKETEGESHPYFWNLTSSAANAATDLGEYELAVKRYEKTLAHYRELYGETHPDYFSIMENMGNCLDYLERYDEAEKMLEKVLEARIAQYGENHINSVSGKINLALNYLRQKKNDKAISYIDDALDFADSSEDVGRHAGIVSDLKQNGAIVHAVTGNLEKANVLISQSLQQQGKLFDSVASFQTPVQQLQAMVDFNEKLDLLISLRRRQANDDIASLSAKKSEAIYQLVYETKGRASMHQTVTRMIADDEDLKREFSSLGELNSGLASLASNLTGDQSNDAEIVGQIESLKSNIFDTQSRIAKLSKDRLPSFGEAANGVKQIQSFLDEQDAFVDFWVYKHHSTEPDLYQVRESEHFLLAFVVTQKKMSVVNLGAIAKVNDLVGQYRKLLIGNAEENTDAKWNQANVSLSKIIVDPVLEAAELTNASTDSPSKLLISPVGKLHELPWPALMATVSDKMLIERFKIATVAIPQLLAANAAQNSLKKEQKLDPSKESLLLVGNVDFGQQTNTPTDSNEGNQLLAQIDRPKSMLRGNGATFGDLPGTKLEVETIKEIWGPDNSVEILEGPGATASAFMQQVQSNSILHVATHGVFFENQDRPKSDGSISFESLSSAEDLFNSDWRSGLAFSGANETKSKVNSSIVYAAQIMEMPLQDVKLVVLSSCESGLGNQIGAELSGEGLSGLQRAFQISGADSVVASLWKVDDQATTILMQEFYRNLFLKKMSKIDALREAQLWMLNNPKSALASDNETKRDLVPDGKKPIKDTRTKAAKPKADSVAKTPVRYWAAFMLSGDWK